MIALLNKISKHRVSVEVVDGKLKLYAESNTVNADLIQEIKANKDALIKYLSEEVQIETSSDTYERISKVVKSDDYEVSHAQNRMWVLSQTEAMNVAYNLPFTVVLTAIKKETIEKAITTLVERHEILRTTFFMNETGEVRQKVCSTTSLGTLLKYIDFSTEENPSSAAQAYIDQDTLQPFNLAEAPLFRTTLLQINDDLRLFYFNIHHSISDGWSLVILKKELYRLCNLYQQNQENDLPKLNIQYKDFAHWQNAKLNTGNFEYQKNYWKQKLHGELPIVDLPATKTRPKVKTYIGECVRTIISKENTQGLKQFCIEQDGSLFIGLLAVTYALITRYTSQHDIIIGTPVSGRDHNDIHNQVGCYVNTIALRNQVDLQDNFKEFYAKIKNGVLSDYENQFYPFDKLLVEMETIKDISRNPIFDIMIILQNLEQVSETNIAADEIETFSIENSIPKCDLDIEFKNVGNYFDFRIHYNTDVYSREMIKGFMKHYSSLLSCLLQYQTESIGTLEFIHKNEKQQLLIDFNDTKINYPTDCTVIDLFKSQVASNPNKLAVKFNEKTLSYKELDEVSNRLANYLIQKGVKPQEFIGIMYRRSAEMIVAMLAALKAQAVYVPISLEYPEDRIVHIIKDAQLKIILSNTSDFPLMEKEIVVNIHEIKNELEAISSTLILPKVRDTDLINCIYTSGSTGNPKGVLLTHEGVVNYIYTVKDDSNITAESKYLQFNNISFDAAGQSIYTSLCFGLSLHIRDDEAVDPEKLHQLITREKITHADMTTSYFVSYVNYLEEENITNQFTCICIGGERLNKHSILKNLSKIKKLTKSLLNLYGPTEATLTQTIFSILQDEHIHERATIPIGKPRANRSILILDSNQKLVPIGVTGEICIGGVGLAKGYLNQPDLTTEKFITHPYNPQERLYKSGDLGKWLPNGDIEFVGRNDQQVKIRGFRIELSEIEEAILTHEHIVNAVVIVHTDHQNKQLIAYYETTEATTPSVLKAYLVTKIPTYMIPTLFIEVEKFESTVNGKIDKKKLPNPKNELIIVTETNMVAPKTNEEKVLVNAWKQVLKYENISTTSDFFDLGGDSIKSIQLTSYVKNNGYSIRLEQILQASILKDMAQLLEQTNQTNLQEAVVGEVPLTPIQHVFFETQTHGIHHNNQSVLLFSKNKLDITIIDSCFTEIIKHHDTLRIRYQKNDATWTQYYHKGKPEEHYTLSTYDLTNSDAPFEEMNLEGDILQKSINIENGPLIRLAIFQLNDGDRLAIIVHHLLIDGVSWRILLDDLMSLYTKIKTKKPIYLPYKTNSYQEWGILQTTYAKSNINEIENQYWKEVCEENVPKIPQDVAGNAMWNSKITHSFSKEITQQLKTKIHSQYKVNLKEVLLTILGLAINEILGVNKITIKMEGHGRVQLDPTMDFSRTLGWFTTIYPFIVAVDNSKTIIENVHATKQRLSNIPNSGIGYGIFKYITKELKNTLKTSVVFNYLGDFDNILANDEHLEFSFSSENIGTVKDDNPNENSMLNVEGIIVNGQLSISIEYANELYNRTTIQNIVNTLEKYITQLIDTIKNIGTDAVIIPTQKNPSDISKLYRKLPWAVFSNYNYVSESAPNYFVIHEGNGELFGYRPFFEQLKETHNIWGFVMDKDTLSPTMVTTEEMSETYGNIIQSLFDEHVEIHILGWSYGGYIAYQMAYYFEKKKFPITIKSVIMVDTMHYLDTNYDEFYQEAFFEKDHSLTLSNEKALVKAICPKIKIENIQVDTIEAFWSAITEEITQKSYDFTIPEYWSEHFKKLYPNIDIYTAFKKINQLRTIGLNLPVPYKNSVMYTDIKYIKAKGSDSSHQNYWNDLTMASFEATEVPGNHGALMQSPYVDGVVQSITKTKIEHKS